MTPRQTILKWAYPLLMKLGNRKALVLHNKKIIAPAQSFYQLNTLLNNGTILNFASLKGKQVLIVNTASDCGYTAQYEELQQLYERFKDVLWIIAFPSNDFKSQESLDDESISAFCKINYGVSFPIAKKSVVIKNDQQNKVFQWLNDPSQNGWNGQSPQWNFSKYLIDEKGILTHYFGPSVSPLSNQVTEALAHKAKRY